jgi:hypothetical protein
VERLDAIVAGIGVLVVLTAVLGAATAPEGVGERGFRIAFGTERLPQPEQEAIVTGDGSAELVVPISARNATRLEFQVEVSAPGPRLVADSLTITLASPEGATEERTGTLPAGPGGSVTVDFAVDVGAAPAERTVRAEDPDGALAQAQSLASANGTGNWTLTAGIASQGGLAAVHTEAHRILVRPSVIAYEASVQPEVPPAR